MQTHQQLRTHHHLPPALNLIVGGQPKICPSQLVLTLLQAILNLVSQAIQITNLVILEVLNVRHPIVRHHILGCILG